MLKISEFIFKAFINLAKTESQSRMIHRRPDEGPRKQKFAENSREVSQNSYLRDTRNPNTYRWAYVSHRRIWRWATVDRTNDLIRRGDAPSGRAKSPDLRRICRSRSDKTVSIWSSERRSASKPILSSAASLAHTEIPERRNGREVTRSFIASAWKGRDEGGRGKTWASFYTGY